MTRNSHASGIAEGSSDPAGDATATANAKPTYPANARSRRFGMRRHGRWKPTAPSAANSLMFGIICIQNNSQQSSSESHPMSALKKRPDMSDPRRPILCGMAGSLI